MALCATQKSMKMVGCSPFSVRCFGNLKVELQTDFRERGVHLKGSPAQGKGGVHAGQERIHTD